ncbi:MAG: hypothetical protein SFU99_01130 [Saprospiraceae bacterium]|nr:hypothetical protein [Saprospiraceae bacterium]
MRKLFIICCVIILFLLSCRGDERERIFDMLYPNINFELPAGLSAAINWAYEIESVASNISFYLNENKVDTALIAGINPVSARITSLDGGFEYDFVEEISIRICNDGRTPCTPADEVFYIDDLRGRAKQTINLLPSLRNAEKSLTRNRFRLDVVFFFRYSTPYSVASRLDMTFEAVK